eukprot:TRINITY_DN3444_c0_g1_i1.p1 TRINITY_DN3444_c0_g1~~TRINITY_DN3444_c0_g1_i1.p1  ORF type:complete len:572 (-),score=154.00 TRINITY_DN3444_c0_g1_i1:27-1742(-)
MSEDSTDSEENQPAICIDTGTGSIKAGFAGDTLPKVTMQTLVGKTKAKFKKLDPEMRDFYFGNEVTNLEEKLIIKYPIEAGVVTDWDMMDKLWQHTFKELDVDPEDRRVLLTEPPHNPKENKEKMVEIMFENYDVGELHIAMQAVMSLYSVGKTTGVVMDIGDGVAHTVPVSDGFILPHNIQRMNLAGRDLTQYLSVLLAKREMNFTTSSEMQIVKRIKEKTAYVALDFEKELKLQPQPYEFELPDNKKISIQYERFECLEPLFKPHLVEMEAPGIHQILYDTVMKCDIDLRKPLFSNIVLTGGTVSCPGMAERLKRELEKTVTTMKIHIAQDDRRDIGVWRGCSVISELRNFDGWVSIDEYLEYGASCMDKDKRDDDDDDYSYRPTRSSKTDDIVLEKKEPIIERTSLAFEHIELESNNNNDEVLEENNKSFATKPNTAIEEDSSSLTSSRLKLPVKCIGNMGYYSHIIHVGTPDQDYIDILNARVIGLYFGYTSLNFDDLKEDPEVCEWENVGANWIHENYIRAQYQNSDSEDIYVDVPPKKNVVFRLKCETFGKIQESQVFFVNNPNH